MLRYFTRGFGFAMREGAFHMDRIGCILQGSSVYKEKVMSWKRVTPFNGKAPYVSADCFVAPNANVIGQAHLGSKVGVYYQTVIRADINEVNIAANTTIQDRCVIRCMPTRGCNIGSHVTIEPGCTVSGADIADDVFIGAGSVIMEGARIESQAIIAPGSVLQKYAVVPSGELWAGVPAAKIRDLTEEEITSLRASALHGVGLSEAHKDVTEKSYTDLDEEETVMQNWAELEVSRKPIRAPYGQYDAGPTGSGTHFNIPGQVVTASGQRVV
eukprot:TRINITY_DN1834_c0_g4_i1.p1 TRINITY_DN1834_c0_g4~~TRINITY_DN1834_c0_g4_i1.p1  ORF type:complete len:271 (+),score=17.47 TRINITY_DN1834_c0_g4_i1:168-980(+)